MKKLSVGMRVWAAVLCAAMVVPWGVLRLLGADITPGYTFSSGEANVTHTKLNNAASGTVNTSFFSGKSSAGSSPNTAFEILVRDTSLDSYKKTTIGAILDHAGLIDNRSVATVPALSDLWLVSQSGAYKALSITNGAFGGTDVAIPTNETRFGFVLNGGVLGSVNLSNLIGAATASTVTTNGDAWLILNQRGEVKKQTSQTFVTGAPAGTNFTGSDVLLSWDGTRLRSNAATNLIDGVGVTNTAPATNDAFTVLQNGALKKLFLNELRTWIGAYAVNLTQSVYSVTTNIAGSSGNWTTVADLGTSALSASIQPRSTNAACKVLVRVVLQATSQGGSDNGYLQVLRGGVAIGTGASDGASRVEAGASIGNASDAIAVVYEFLDTTGPTNTVYAVQVQAPTGNTVYINRDSSDANSTANGRYMSSITLTEVQR